MVKHPESDPRFLPVCKAITRASRDFFGGGTVSPEAEWVKTYATYVLEMLDEMGRSTWTP